MRETPQRDDFALRSSDTCETFPSRVSRIARFRLLTNKYQYLQITEEGTSEVSKFLSLLIKHLLNLSGSYFEKVLPREFDMARGK